MDRRRRRRSNLNTASDGDEDSRRRGSSGCHQMRASIDCHRADESIQSDVHVFSEISIWSKWNVNNILRLQSDIGCLTMNDGFIVHHRYLRLAQGSSQKDYMI